MPDVDRHQRALDLIEYHGLRLERVGNVWHISGPGVDIRTSALSTINRTDLLPVTSDRDVKRYMPR